MMSESRPNRAMNQGAPAATAGISGADGSKMRSAARSVSLRAKVAARAAESVSKAGLAWRQRVIRSAGSDRSIAAPIGNRTGSAASSIVIDTPTDACQLPWGGTTARHEIDWGVITASGAWTVTRRCLLPCCPVATHPSGPVCTVTARSEPPRPSLTSNRSARSQATSKLTLAPAASEPWLRSTMSSRMPEPTYRRLSTINVGSSRPARSAARETNTPKNGSSLKPASACTGWPSTVKRHREMTRASLTKRPSAPSPLISPPGPQTAKVAPSTRVRPPVSGESAANPEMSSGSDSSSKAVSPRISRRNLLKPLLSGR